MADTESVKNLEKIRIQIELLKQRLDNIDRTLDLQEEVLDVLDENSKSLLQDALNKNQQGNSVNEIMKSAFTRGNIPKILSKK